jgi:uncharacterized repeat protein (TIGR01451 family)
MAKLHRALVVLCLFLAPMVFAQSADQEVVSVGDSPDPVLPGATLTYTVTLRNNGPNAATNGGLNINLAGALTHSTDSVPAGWTCFWAGNNGTCNTPSFTAGTTEILTINAVVGAHLANFPDQNIDSNFSPSGTTPDPNNANNSKAATTTVNAPQIDLAVVSAMDSPDPVFPDGNVTYNVTVANNGPDTATSVNFNVVPNSSLRFVSATVPSGWNCTLPSVGAVNATFTCSRPSWAMDAGDDFVVVFSANDEQFGINDTTFDVLFSVNGTGDDTTDGNNTGGTTTTYQTPDADIVVLLSDSPDPVAPDGDITYTVTVDNDGPDTAPNISLNSFGGNNLRFVSASVPAGWNCTLPAAGAQTAGWNCTLASMVSGDSDVLTFVLEASQDLNGIADGNIMFGFSANSSISDPDNGNNSKTESTGYSTSDANVSVMVADSPDPVTPDGNITYTVTVENGGPDTAPNITLNSFGANNLRFVSATVPAGWNCTLPSAGTQTTSLSCTLASMVSGDSDELTFVMQADDELLGNADTNILFGFSANSSVADPEPDDNSETASTAYDVPNANLGVTASDSPDPVAAGNNITYTGNITNVGPQTATDVTFTVPLFSGLLFVSLADPAGFSCAEPAAGTNGTITCTIASLESGANLAYTLVAQVDPALNNGPDGFIEQTFLIGSATNDPTPGNNELEVLTAYTTPDADITVTNSDTPDPVAPGGVITYTQTITNNGPQTAVNATFTQTLPASVGYVSLGQVGAAFSCVTPASGASGTITCTRASFTSGETTTFTLVVDVLANSGTVANTVTGDSDTFDPDNTDNTASVSTTIVTPESADLSISKFTPTTSASPGDTINYTITLTNSGPDDATAVVMTDTLPASLLFVSITEPAGFDCVTPAVGASGTITCTAATMADGTTAQFNLAVTVADGADSGTVTNSASVASATGDPDDGDTSDPAPPVALGPVTADLSISKFTGANSATPGTTISYTITVTNDGPDAAEDVVVTDILPAEVLFVSISEPAGFDCTTPAVETNGTITCTAATMANGASAQFNLTVRVADGADSGSVTNSASVVSSTNDSDGGDTTDPAPPVALGPAVADVSIVKTTTTTEAETGETVFFTITVSNAGPSTASNVVVTDELPAGLALVLASPSQGTCNGTTTVTCSLGDILAGANATITLQTTVTGTSGTVSNTATVTSADGDPDGDDNESTTPPFPIGEPAGGPAQVPTLSEWALLALAMMLGVAAVTKMRM